MSAVSERNDQMEKQMKQVSQAPKFANEKDEAKWWASPEGRTFLKQLPLPVQGAGVSGGSKLVTKLA